MTESTRELLSLALDLSTDERAELAAALLGSLDGEPDEAVDVAWAREIETRAHDVEAGEATLEDWESVLDRARRRTQER